MKRNKLQYYVWEFPVRFTHWINFIGILILSVTGYYIADPFIHATSTKQYIMGWIRLIHFITAYALVMSIIIRIYWALIGNSYSRFRTWFPFSGHIAKSIPAELKFYFLASKTPPNVVGHTAMGGLALFIVYLILIFEIISGFALYSVNHSGLIWTISGGWLVGVMQLQTIRLYHHLTMYLLLAFGILHVYIAWYSDRYERNGLMGSIFSGYKFLSEKEIDYKS